MSSIDLDDGRWKVNTQTGEGDVFDVVVLTMPVPQLFGLSGTIKGILGGWRRKEELTSRRWRGGKKEERRWRKEVGEGGGGRKSLLLFFYLLK